MGRQSKTVQFPVESVKSGENSIGGDFGDCERGNTTTPEGEEAQNHHSTYVLNVKRMGRRNRIIVSVGRCTSPNEVGHGMRVLKKQLNVDECLAAGTACRAPTFTRIHNFNTRFEQRKPFLNPLMLRSDPQIIHFRERTHVDCASGQVRGRCP